MLKLLTKGESRIVYCPYDEAFDWNDPGMPEAAKTYMETADNDCLRPFRTGDPTPFEVVGLSGYERARCRVDKDDTLDWCYEVLRYGLKAAPILDPAWRVDGIWPRSVVDQFPSSAAESIAVLIIKMGSFDEPTKKASTSSPMAGGESGLIATAAKANQS